MVDDPDKADDWEEIADQHPEIGKMKADVTAAEALIGSVKAEFYPKIDLYARYGMMGRDNSSYLDSWGNLKPENYTVGVRLTANLFSGFGSTERLKQASLQASIARRRLGQKEVELADFRNQKLIQVKKARNDLSLAQERAKLEQAKQKVVQTQFEAGKCSELDYRRQRVDTENAADAVAKRKIEVALAQIAFRLASVN